MKGYARHLEDFANALLKEVEEDVSVIGEI